MALESNRIAPAGVLEVLRRGGATLVDARSAATAVDAHFDRADFESVAVGPRVEDLDPELAFGLARVECGALAEGDPGVTNAEQVDGIGIVGDPFEFEIARRSALDATDARPAVRTECEERDRQVGAGVFAARVGHSPAQRGGAGGNVGDRVRASGDAVRRGDSAHLGAGRSRRHDCEREQGDRNAKRRVPSIEPDHRVPITWLRLDCGHITAIEPITKM